MSINYEYKQYCLSCNYLDLYISFRKSFYNICKDYSLTDRDKELIISTGYSKFPELVRMYGQLLDKFDVFKKDSDIFNECRLLYNSLKQRKRRLKKRVTEIVSKPALFVTLTFSPKYLNNSTFEERRRSVREYLKDNSSNYVANIDFGKKNGREHYHALVQAESINLKTWHKFGGLKIKKVYTGFEDSGKLVTYINKLTNHGLKATAKRYALIYSR